MRDELGEILPSLLKNLPVGSRQNHTTMAGVRRSYFEIAQLTRISPETYRVIASFVSDGHLLHNGESIALNSANSRKVAAEMRRELSATKDAARPVEIGGRLMALDKPCDSIVREVPYGRARKAE
jgi:hypothetical protein